MEKIKVQNRRKVPRIKLVCPLIITYAKNQYQGLIRNLSYYGLSISCSDILPFEEDYEFRFSFPDGLAISAKGELLWRVPEGAAYIYGAKISIKGFLARLKFRHHIRKNSKKNPADNPHSLSG